MVAQSMVNLTPATSLEAMLVAPAGRYVSGSHFLFICQSESLYATFVWGRPGAEASQQLIAALATEVRPAALPHRSLIDFSDLTSVDIDAFNTLREFIEKVKPLQAKLTEREAVIRPGGISGTVVAGFYLLYPPPYVAKVFARADEAAAWLGGVDEPTLRAWLALRDQVRGTSPFIMQLQNALSARLSEIDLQGAASALGVSSRSLQRQLKSAGTSFQNELDRARLTRADSLVASSDDKLGVIARVVGFKSAQHFSDWFRKHRGVTPESWRLRARAKESVTAPSEATTPLR